MTPLQKSLLLIAFSERKHGHTTAAEAIEDAILELSELQHIRETFKAPTLH